MRDVPGAIPENSRALLSAILKQVVGSECSSIRPIKGIGMNNSVSVVETPHGPFVVRTNVESHLFRFQREAWCYKQLESSSVLTPTVVGCGVLNEHSYSVAHFIENSQPIHDGVDQLRVWRTLGGYARQLNQVAPPASGSQEAAYFPMSWEKQAADDIGLIFKTTLWRDAGMLSQEQQEQITSYLQGCASTTGSMGICQFDMTIANAVICGDDYNKIYLLDLESANVAPVPRYQLACIAADRGLESEPVKAFFEGYGLASASPDALDPELERFLLYRLMRATAWARDRYPSLLAENLRRTEPVLTRVVGRLR